MSESNPATPAPTPAPVATAIDAAEAHKREMDRIKNMTSEATYQTGRNKGKDEGRAEAAERMKSIIAVCPGKPQMAIDAFLSGQTPEAVKLAFDAAAQVEAAARLREQEKDLEIARWQQLAATGGYPNGIGMVVETEDNGAPSIDPKAQAEAEWDHKPAVRKGFTSKDHYVSARVRELSGGLQFVRSLGDE